MKNFLINICLALCACLLVACDQGLSYFSLWEGEYVATETLEEVDSNGHIDTFEIERPLPLYIFQDRGLYVQTYGIGDPFIPDVDKEEHVLYARSPKRLGTKRDTAENDSVENEGIEEIVLTDDKYFIVCINGRIYTIKNEHVISPKPIRVAKASPDNLVLRDGSNFECPLTDASGNMIDTLVCHWEYSPIQKTNDSISWVAELHEQSKIHPEQGPLFRIVRHRLVLTKK